MNQQNYPPIDAKGRPIEISYWVKLGFFPPDYEKLAKHTQELIRFSLGKIFQIKEINEQGMVKIDSSIYKNSNAEIWVEPNILILITPLTSRDAVEIKGKLRFMSIICFVISAFFYFMSKDLFGVYFFMGFFIIMTLLLFFMNNKILVDKHEITKRDFLSKIKNSNGMK